MIYLNCKWEIVWNNKSKTQMDRCSFFFSSIKNIYCFENQVQIEHSWLSFSFISLCWLRCCMNNVAIKWENNFFLIFKTYKTNWIQMEHEINKNAFSWNSNQNVWLSMCLCVIWCFPLNVGIDSAESIKFVISDLWWSAATNAAIDISPRYVRICITFCQNQKENNTQTVL